MPLPPVQVYRGTLTSPKLTLALEVLTATSSIDPAILPINEYGILTRFFYTMFSTSSFASMTADGDGEGTVVQDSRIQGKYASCLSEMRRVGRR